MARGAVAMLLVLVACETPTTGLVGDAGPRDALAADATPRDATAPDAVVPDETALDAVVPDETALDAAAPDAEPLDAEAPDAAPRDAAEPLDAQAPDAAGPAPGCANGVRTGFLDTTAFPDIAACGPRTDYPTAMLAGPLACAPDFHVCTPNDPHVLALGGTPTPTNTIAWLRHEAPVCGFEDYIFTNPTCSGAFAQAAAVRGAGGCENSGGCGQGYRLVLWSASWGWSGRLTSDPVACRPNINHACGYGGGAIPVLPASVACCRN